MPERPRQRFVTTLSRKLWKYIDGLHITCYWMVRGSMGDIMAKARSPAYPTIGLKEAIDGVSRIYKEDYQNPIPRELAARHMGYNSLNGKSLGALSALLKYGLLEGRGNETRVSDLAVR